MTDLLQTLPSFSTQPYTHLLPSLEKNLVTTTDLLTLDAIDVAKRAQLPVNEVRRLSADILGALRGELGIGKIDQNESDPTPGVLRKTGPEIAGRWSTISTLDPVLDGALGGGIPTGYITELTGESGVGKTQFLLTLLLSTQLPPPHGLSKRALYISTEAPLPTARLSQLLQTHPLLSARAAPATLANILSITVPDLESQDHILAYQLPVAVERSNIGLVVLDSVAANYRAEFAHGQARRWGAGLAQRSAALVRLGGQLRAVARMADAGVAVVVANQVADRFGPPGEGGARGATAAAALSLDHQQRWYTGWGADPAARGAKTPALGHTWALQLGARVALRKTVAAASSSAAWGERAAAAGRGGGWRRELEVVFAPWAAADEGGVEFEITAAGVRAVEWQADGQEEEAEEDDDDDDDDDDEEEEEAGRRCLPVMARTKMDNVPIQGQ